MTILRTVVLALVIGSSVRAGETNVELPTAQTIVRDLEYSDVKLPHLLAFKAQVDTRPLYAETALLALELTNSYWRVVHVYRHPKEKIAHWRRWAVATRTDVPYPGSREFVRKPTEAEVDKFLRDTEWEFRAWEGFRLVRIDVFKESWQKALGYTPEYEAPASKG